MKILTPDDVILRIVGGGGTGRERILNAPLHFLKRTGEEGWLGINDYVLRPGIKARLHVSNTLKVLGRVASCACCGQEMVQGHRYSVAPNRFCSARCEREVYRQRAAERARARYVPQRAEPHAMTCQHCGSDFNSKRNDARYCGVKCRVAAHRASK